MAKRRDERRCSNCNALMSGRGRLCGPCVEDQKRRDAGYRSVPTRSGAVEMLLPQHPGEITPSTVFRSPFHLSEASTGEEFVASLLAIVLDGRATHVPEAHRTWLAAMLYDLLQVEVEVGWNPRQKHGMATLPHRQLGLAVRHWVLASFSEANRLPLLPYFVLAAAGFIADHYRGGYMQSADARELCVIEGAAPDELRRGPFSFLEEASFKRDFTSHVGGIAVRGVVPPGGKFREIWHGEEFGPGTRFEFVVERCPLSSGFYDNIGVAHEDQTPGYDYFRSFVGYGHFAKDEHLKAEIPFGWLTEHRVSETPNPEKPWDVARWEPLPDWLRATPSGGPTSPLKLVK